MVMRIALRWGQEPNWFYTLDEQTKINVLAEYRLFHEDSDKIKKRQDRNKSDMMKREIERRTE
jgi:hypothetical protein